MENNGNSKPIKKDNIPDSTKRQQNKVLGKALKTVFTGKSSSGNQGSSPSNSSKVAPQ